MTRDAAVPATNDLPAYMPVFRSEKDLPFKGAKRRHAFRICWGSGSGAIAWSQETTQTLHETKWAPKDHAYPPTDGRYTVQLIGVKIDGEKIERSGPIVIDPRAKPRPDQKIISWEKYKAEDQVHRNRIRNSDRVKERGQKLTELRQNATNETQLVLLGAGPRRLYLLLQEHAAQARALRKDIQGKPEQRTQLLADLDKHLNIIEEAAKILATLKWK